MMRRNVCVIALLMLVAEAPAFGAEPGSNDPARSDDLARSLFDQGMALVSAAKGDGDRSKYELALKKFETSYALSRSAGALTSVAVTEERLGRHVDAMHHSREVLRLPNAKPDALKLARENMEAASKYVASVDVRAPSGAQVLVDGASSGETMPLADPLDLPPGPHTIRARHGSQIAEANLDAVAGTAPVIALTFQPKPSAPADAAVSTASVGSLLDRQPPPSTSDNAGVTPPTFWNTRRIVGLAVSGAGLLGLAGGGYFAAQASSEQSRAQNAGVAPGACNGPAQPSGCSALRDAHSAQTSDTTASAVSTAIGAAFLLTGIALVVWPSSGQTTLAPVASAHGVELQLRGAL